MELEKIRDWFLAFAKTECEGNSELYYNLCIDISKDKDLLKIASFSKAGQPIPNIFLASIHYLLLKNSESELAKYYPSITRQSTKDIPFSIFKNYCIKNETEIREIISTKIVQTNSINRCAYLMPIFSKIISEENKPTTIIDIGTSAGLTLNFDKYEYWYNGQKVYGDSKVSIKSKIIDSNIPKIFKINHQITKIGIDQNIIDPTNSEEILWLKALIWADQLERFTAIDEALKLDELKKIHYVQGNTIQDIENEISKTDKDQNLIIYATHVLYQFPQEQKNEFYNMLDRIGKEKDYHFLSVEGIKLLHERYNSKETIVELTQYNNQQKTKTFLAETNGHGTWIKWK